MGVREGLRARKHVREREREREGEREREKVSAQDRVRKINNLLGC